MTKTDTEGVKTGTPPTGSAALNPGDEAAPGTMGTGEDVCPDCHGTSAGPEQSAGRAALAPGCGFRLRLHCSSNERPSPVFSGCETQ
jgi:hypothetical protein